MVDFPDNRHNAAQQSNITFQQVQSVMNQATPVLSEDYLIDYVEANFRKGKQFIHTVGGHRTPCYLFEPGVIISRAKLFRRVFQHRLPDTGFYFAMKSNNFHGVSKTVLGCGFGLDVSSGAELEMALELGAEDIVFSGPGKSVQELDLAIENSDRVVVLIDSFTEMARLEKRAARKGSRIRAGVRLSTDPEGLWRKFGIPLQDLRRFIHESKRFRHIKFRGIQFHTSWNMGPERQVEFIKKLGEEIKTLTSREREQISFIDIGGGYWPEHGEWLQPGGTPGGALKKALGIDPLNMLDRREDYTIDRLSETINPQLAQAIKSLDAPVSAYTHYCNPAESIERFASELSKAIAEYIHSQIQCRICFEPGRWICNDSMHIILKVVDKKYDDLIITDGATNAVGWERFETDYCPVINISRPALIERDALITGSLCTPHDIWGYSYWGKDIQDGDLLMIPGQGAYTYSLRQNFIKSVPEVIYFP